MSTKCQQNNWPPGVGPSWRPFGLLFLQAPRSSANRAKKNSSNSNSNFDCHRQVCCGHFCAILFGVTTTTTEEVEAATSVSHSKQFRAARFPRRVDSSLAKLISRPKQIRGETQPWSQEIDRAHGSLRTNLHQLKHEASGVLLVCKTC